jgi:perosamine synthetase
MAEMSQLMELARKYGLAIIEDAAEARGAKYHGRRAGGIGTMGCFSFYANKIVTTGEGGMVVTNDSKLAGRLASPLAKTRRRSPAKPRLPHAAAVRAARD